MRRLMIPLFLAYFLSACQAPSTPIAAQKEAAQVNSSGVNKLVTSGAMRTEMFELRLWGITTSNYYPVSPYWPPTITFNGNGTLTSLGIGGGNSYRFSYTVPTDRVLHISRAISPYNVKIDSVQWSYETTTGGVKYPGTFDTVFFGPGQTIILSTDGAMFGGSSPYYGAYEYAMTVSGYTVSADAFLSTGGAGGVLGVK